MRGAARGDRGGSRALEAGGGRDPHLDPPRDRRRQIRGPVVDPEQEGRVRAAGQGGEEVVDAECLGGGGDAQATHPGGQERGHHQVDPVAVRVALDDRHERAVTDPLLDR